MKQFLSEYEYTSGDSQRRAKIIDDGGWWVEMWQGESIVERRNLNEHTKAYAKECAENWVEGRIK